MTNVQFGKSGDDEVHAGGGHQIHRDWQFGVEFGQVRRNIGQRREGGSRILERGGTSQRGQAKAASERPVQRSADCVKIDPRERRGVQRRGLDTPREIRRCRQEVPVC